MPSNVLTGIANPPKLINPGDQSRDDQLPKKCFHGFDVGNQTMPRFTMEGKIGRSSASGVVYKGFCHRHCDVAIKRSLNEDQRGNRATKKEIEWVKQVCQSGCQSGHPNMIEYFGYFDLNGIHHMVFELGESNFKDFVFSHLEQISIEHINNIMCQLLEMVSFLKDKDIFNRDISG